MSRLVSLSIVAVLAGPTLFADATWTRSYETNSARVFSWTADHALVVAGHEIFTIGKDGQPGDSIAVKGRIGYYAAASANGDVFLADLENASIVITKIAADRSARWRHAYSFERPLRISSLTATGDAGAILVGSYDDDAEAIVRIDAEGAAAWGRVIDLSGEEALVSVRETRDRGCVAVGDHNGHPWLVKLDANGRLQWHRRWTPSGRFNAVAETNGGDIVAVGSAGDRAMAVKVTSAGDVVWQKTDGLDRPSAGYAIDAGSDEVVLLTAHQHERDRLTVLRLKDDGSLRWARSLATPEPFRLGLPVPESLASMGSLQLLVVPPMESSGRTTRMLTMDERGRSCESLRDAGDQVQWNDAKWVGESFPAETRSLATSVVRGDTTVSATKMASSIVACAPASTDAESTPPRTVFAGHRNEAAMRERYGALLEARKFDELDVEAKRLRRDDPFDNLIIHHIDVFYSALAASDTLSHERQTALLREWITAQPSSVAAKIALAESLHDRAWALRGEGFVSTITRTGAAEYERLLREAQSVLNAVGEAGEADRHYWVVRLRVDHELGGVHALQTFRRAVQLHQHPRVFSYAALYLLEKWGGSREEYLAFMDEAARLSRETLGETMYAHLADTLRLNLKRADFEQEYAPFLDWNRIAQGLRDRIERSPAWLPTYHMFAEMAFTFNDRITARELFSKPQLAWLDDLDTWTSRSQYEAVRAWALAKPVEPFILERPSPTPFAKWPAIVMQNDVVLTSGKEPRRVSFSVATATGPMAISVVTTKLASRGPNPLDTLRLNLVNWTMSAPNDLRHPATVSIATEKADWMTGIALRFNNATPSVHRLKPLQPGSSARQGKGYVVGCKWTNEKCAQVIERCSFYGEQLSTAGQVQTWNVHLRTADPQADFVGGPILDGDGYVVGVVRPADPFPNVRANAIESREKNLRAEDIRLVLASVSSSGPVKAEAPEAADDVFTRRPFAEWPSIVMQTRIEPSPGSETRIGSFLLQTETAVLAVSVVPPHPPAPPWPVGVAVEVDPNAPPPNRVRDRWLQMSSWTMWSPASPARVLRAASLLTNDPQDVFRGVALSLAQSKTAVPVVALKARAATSRPDYLMPCFIVGCRWSGRKCTPAVMQAKVLMSAGATVDGPPSSYVLALNEVRDDDDFVGAAVLDDNARVFAVASGTSSARMSEFPHLMDADAISRVLPPTTAPAAPPASPGTNGGS